jgi:hypothetical protein
VSARIRNKTDYTDQNVGNRTRSKMQCMCNSSVQNLLFPLHDVILFQGHGKFEGKDLQLEIMSLRLTLIAYTRYMY